MEKILQANINQKKAGMATLISHEVHSQQKKWPDRGRHYIMIKESICQENIVILNMHAPNKSVAKCVKQYIKRTVYHSQVKFIPGMQDWFNVWKSVNVICHINKLKKWIQ